MCRRITIIEGTVAIESGCNTGSGSVTVGEDTLMFGPIATVARECERDQSRLPASVVLPSVGLTVARFAAALSVSVTENPDTNDCQEFVCRNRHATCRFGYANGSLQCKSVPYVPARDAPYLPIRVPSVSSGRWHDDVISGHSASVDLSVVVARPLGDYGVRVIGCARVAPWR